MILNSIIFAAAIVSGAITGPTPDPVPPGPPPKGLLDDLRVSLSDFPYITAVETIRTRTSPSAPWTEVQAQDVAEAQCNQRLDETQAKLASKGIFVLFYTHCTKAATATDETMSGKVTTPVSK